MITRSFHQAQDFHVNKYILPGTMEPLIHQPLEIGPSTLPQMLIEAATGERLPEQPL